MEDTWLDANISNLQDHLKNNFTDDLKTHFKDGLLFSKNLETLPLNKEDVGNHVALGWSAIFKDFRNIAP